MGGPPIVQAYREICAELTAPGAPFEVCEADVLGARARVYRHAPSDVRAILGKAESDFADRDFIRTEDRRLTFGALFTAGRRLAAHLAETYGVSAGDHIGLAMRNRPEWFIAYAALVRLGAVAVLLNSRDAGEQMAYCAANVQCRLVIADRERADRLEAAGFDGRLLVVDSPAGGFDTLIGEGAEDCEVAQIATDAAAAILFTSGTTGRSKGAVLTHRNFCNMAANMQFLAALNVEMTARRAAGVGAAPQARVAQPSTLMVFPMFHISGICTFFGTLLTGGVIHMMRRWNPDAAIELIHRRQVTSVTGPPLMLSDLIDQPNAAERLASLGAVTVGGQATPGNLVERVCAMLPRASQAQSWGMTELSGAVSSARDALFLAAPDACGPPLPIAEVEARDENGRVLGPGEAGELWVRSSLAMRGYCNAPEANAAVFDANRWLRTGDIGYLDVNGFVHVVDRKKDMVISGGENIYCAEVERVLALDLDFTEVALFGVPDARLGERAVAAVTLRPGVSRTEASVQAFVGERLADYKVPAAVTFDLGSFPRNATGKIDKAALRRRYLEKGDADV